mgnify:CR=1 FL=1
MNILFKFSICGFFSSLLFPPFFILPLGFITFPYLFSLLINEKFLKKSKIFQFGGGLIFGFTMVFFILFWIQEPFLIDEKTSNYSLVSYLLVIYCSIYFGLIFLFLGYINSNIAKLILIPILIIISEIIRENLFYGFPWITFALVFSGNDFLINLIYYFGTHGLSYLVLLFFIFPAVLLLFENNRKLLFLYILISIGIFIVSLILILFKFYQNEEKNEIELTISVIQLNTSQADRNKIINSEKRLKEITNIIENDLSDIIIFAENEFPYIVRDLQELSFIQQKLKNNQSLILGAVREENAKYFNSFIFIEKNNIQEFHKMKLVPFGEFLPLRKFLFFLEPIVGNKDFTSGKKNRLIQNSNNLSVIPIICYEIIFTKILLNQSNQNANLLINITNDSWFGNISGPYQHFYLSRLRAVELNKPLIRVSNNGISAIIDNNGKIVKHTLLNEKKIIRSNIDIFSNHKNLLKYHNLIFLFLVVFFIISLLINNRINERNKKSI